MIASFNSTERDFAAISLAAERRAADRVPCTLTTMCKPLGGARTKAWPATAMDISTGGMAIVLGRRFEPGAILLATLASADGETTRTLFLRVAHITRQDDGTWRLGCAFAKELSQDELDAFEIEKDRPQALERRAWVRFSCNVPTQCRVVAPAQSEVWPARVLEVSPGGMNLLAPVELERGTILSVKLPDGKALVPRFVLVRVLRIDEFSSDRWFLACEFADQITNEDLLRFQ
jgi:hypothetical protein